jgi:ribonuclease HI|tara:strand:+ start:717 stop:1169 length:453 start_codon:yes stop_codon:yes gene_type:complete
VDKIEIYTDGAAKGNPGPGGYGVILRSGRLEKELSQGFYHTTNNRMELLAVIVGLETLKKKGNKVYIYSDSKYVVDPINKKWLDQWQKKSWSKVKNIDLWKRLLIALRDQKVSFFWIKGHNEHPENERCDQLAVMASKSPTLEDRGYLKD